MFAEALPTPAPLPLLLEPLRPKPGAPKCWGWHFVPTWQGHGMERRLVRFPTRDHSNDAQGALVQHVIVRYLVWGVERQQLARETGYSTRQLQAFIGGRAWEPYSVPVLEALAELGITPHRGYRGGNGSGSHSTSGHRLLEIIGAQERLLDTAAGLLGRSQDEGARDFMAGVRLLLAGREPLDGRGAP